MPWRMMKRFRTSLEWFAYENMNGADFEFCTECDGDGFLLFVSVFACFGIFFVLFSRTYIYIFVYATRHAVPVLYPQP